MPNYKHKLSKHFHTNPLLQIVNSLYYYIICSTFILNNNSSCDSQIKTIKPNNYNNKEITPYPLWSLEENNTSKNFINKKDYLKQRSPLIKNIKYICEYFSLSFKTYFLSIEYLNIISSKLSFFHPNVLFKISLLCLILAAKFNEQAPKILQVQKALKNDLSNNYLVDEIYVLHLLDYKLNIFTSYDMLIDIINFGFIFEGEEFDNKKMNYLYSNLQKILYFFSEINSYIDMAPKQIAVSIIGFIRELLDLTPFNEKFKKIFLINEKNEQFYQSGLEIIKKRIKIENEIKGNEKINEVNSIKDERKNNITLF